MYKKLFFTCPFDSLEVPLKQKFGCGIHIITCSACNIPYDDGLFIELVQACITDNSIVEVNFVIDAQSRLINDVICSNPLFGLNAEYSIQDLFLLNYDTYFRGYSINQQKLNLADLIIQQQIDAFLFSDYFSDLIIDNRIKVNGIVYSDNILNMGHTGLVRYNNFIYEL